MNTFFCFDFSEPILMTSIHSGHDIPSFILQGTKVEEEIRLREEDPYTDFFTEISSNRVNVRNSRFYCDLNRSFENCVYVNPEDAWGLEVRNKNFNSAMLEKCREEYLKFYRQITVFINEMLLHHNRIALFDIHSYNHHRLGSDKPFDNPELNPDIILATHVLPESEVKFIGEIKNILEKELPDLNIKINVKFDGGYFVRWVYRTYGKRVIPFSIEFKKIFMDEWTGKVDYEKQNIFRNALQEILYFTKVHLINEK
ncbi:MAG: hypothetical protein CSB55_08765 [Candidatus Cloacimonadota bacterium]|nr:MAG: hypothetical protein CSB55_08765 [Candidatus Cloacimonadota bacterium]